MNGDKILDKPDINHIKETVSTTPTLILKILIVILIAYILIKASEHFMDNILKKKASVGYNFFRTLLKSCIVFLALFKIGGFFEEFRNIQSTILMSSSLLIAVIGFAFQKSLEDLIAGIMISIFNPFEIGDRITLKDSGISGYIENITVRHTIIRTFTNSRLIIPNSIMNKAIVENSDIIDTKSSNSIDITVGYNTDFDLAYKIINNIVENHPNTIDTRTEEDIKNNKPYSQVYINEILNDGPNLRFFVWTKTLNENFSTCSDIRRSLIEQFRENDIEMPYVHSDISGKIEIKNVK